MIIQSIVKDPKLKFSSKYLINKL